MLHHLRSVHYFLGAPASDLPPRQLAARTSPRGLLGSLFAPFGSPRSASQPVSAGLPLRATAIEHAAAPRARATPIHSPVALAAARGALDGSRVPVAPALTDAPAPIPAAPDLPEPGFAGNRKPRPSWSRRAVSNRVSLAELEPAAVEPPVASGDLPQDLHRAQVDLGVALATHQRERAVHGQQVRAFERRIDELSGELASARAQLTTRDDAAQRLTEATAMIRALEIIRDSQLELLGRADAELSQVRAGRDGAQEALRRVQADLQQLEQRAAPWDAAQTSKLTPASALALAEVLFADDLVVTKAARKAAHRSPFRDGHLVFEVLALLALHAAHGGDATSCVQQALGNKARWRSKDSKETVATFRSERTVTGCDGARSSLRTHVTLGHGPRADACLQIYYQLDAQGRVEVQHCGEHKCTVSHDT